MSKRLVFALVMTLSFAAAAAGQNPNLDLFLSSADSRPLVRLRTAAVAVAWSVFLLLAVGPVVVSLALLALAPWHTSVPVAVGSAVFALLVGRSMVSAVH